MNYEANRRVETSAKTFAIVERLSEIDRAGVSALAADLDMSKGIVHNHLSTLRELGYVRKLGDDYQLSPRLLQLGLQARSSTQLYRFGHELCREFASQLDSAVLLCQHTADDCTVIDAHGVPATMDIAIGTDLSLSRSLIGLAVQLTIPPTDGTVSSVPEYDLDHLRSTLDTAGYVTGDLSPEYDVDCIAVPLRDDDGECHGGMGVVLPEGETEQRRQRLAEAITSFRDRIERRFDSGWGEERSVATEKHTWIG